MAILEEPLEEPFISLTADLIISANEGRALPACNALGAIILNVFPEKRGGKAVNCKTWSNIENEKQDDIRELKAQLSLPER
jgi:hypothetical protein